MTRLLAIDPTDCGCTECLTGLYQPLRHATSDDIVALLTGKLRNHLSAALELAITAEVEPDYGLETTQITVTYGNLSWDLPTWCLPLLLVGR